MEIKSNFSIREIIIHLCWVIGLLLLGISFLVIRVPDGAVIRDFIAFSASIASLVLAIVAIVYSFISNQGFSNLVGSLKETTTKIEEASVQVGQSATVIRDETKLLTGHIVEIPIAMKDLGDRFEKQSKIATTDIYPVPVTSKIDGLTRPTKNTGGSDLALYVCIVAFETSKTFNPTKIFTKSAFLRGYVIGALQLLIMNDFLGIVLEKDGDVFSCSSLGKLDIEYVRRVTELSKNEAIVKQTRLVDEYFGIEAAETIVSE